MARGSKSNNNNDDSKLFIFKIKITDENKKKLDAPIFEVREKSPQGQWIISGTENSFAGDLSRAEVKVGEFEGQPTYNISLYFKDKTANETYLLDLKLNMLTRGLLNSLLNVKEFEDIKISLYQGKNGYPAVAIRAHGELVKWKYSLDEMPPVESVTFKGRKMNDYSQIDEFFIAKIKELGSKLSGSAVQSKVQEVLTRTSDAMKLSRQSGLSAADSVTALTAVIKKSAKKDVKTKPPEDEGFFDTDKEVDSDESLL
jgi:hypothetical protein